MSVPPLSECAVVIVGGTSGSGLAGARLFAREGVTRIALLGRNEERGAAARQTVLEQHPAVQVEFIPCDATEPESAAAAAGQARAKLGAIDVLVNSTSGIYVPKLLRDVDLHEIEPMLTGQALAPMYMSKVVLPLMTEQGGGVIVNVASDAAKVPTPGETVLGAAMAAIVSFTRTLAMEAKRDGIRVNVITPSLIEGTIIGEKAMEGGFSKKLFEKVRTMAHLGPTEPDDLAELMVFLASPAAARITGQAISVNGGISAA